MSPIYVLSFILFFLGLVLVVLTGKSLARLPQPQESKNTDYGYTAYLQQINQKLEEFNRELENLKAEMAAGHFPENAEKFTEKLSQILVQEEKKEEEREPVVSLAAKEGDFKEIETSTPLTLKDKIYIEYKKGKGITQLAKEFGKGKGEIELILNLRR